MSGVIPVGNRTMVGNFQVRTWVEDSNGHPTAWLGVGSGSYVIMVERLNRVAFDVVVMSVLADPGGRLAFLNNGVAAFNCATPVRCLNRGGRSAPVRTPLYVLPGTPESADVIVNAMTKQQSQRGLALSPFPGPGWVPVHDPSLPFWLTFNLG